jgi:hypothetical protein
MQVEKFKNDYMKGRELYASDTLYTKSALLTRERLSALRLISTFPNDQKVQHDEYYYNDTRVLESNISYKLPNRELTGVTRKYNRKGELEYEQDYDKGTWVVMKFDHYPYYDILVKIKSKGDSLIEANYGREFLARYVVWSPEGSAFYSEDGAGATWNDYQEWKPSRFLLRYSIRLSQDVIYDEQIEINFNSSGQVIFPSDKYDDVKGFDRGAIGDGYVLTKGDAIEKAKKIGLVESDSTKAFTFLTWNYDIEAKKELQNGHFVYCVGVVTKIIQSKLPHDRNRIEYKYDVYSFNPWTGVFLERKKMKAFREWERFSGLSTGLMPDE